jgi:asparagine synthase (glutamine-hydrolysing)
MCGIVGLVHIDRGRPVHAGALRRMRDLMIMRGPDDEGQVLQGNVGFGHRRLSVIDISGGHQPMSDPDGRYLLTYNGEVYNFLELRSELEGRGRRFRTHCDSEVILHAYAEWGESCVERFNGMFAFAVWDRVEQTLFAARDRAGKKPFYYAWHDDTFLFASEIKSIVAYDGFPAEVQGDNLAEYLTFNFVSGDETLLRGVRCLPPGHVLTLRDGRLAIRGYWDVAVPRKPQVRNLSEAVERLEVLLEDAVRKRLISDVPLGTFNSGGIDSSLVTALVARQKGEGLHSFSVGFEEPDYDERRYANLLSRRYGTDHHEIVVTGEQFASELPRMIWYNDEPLNHPNSVQIFFVSRLAKEFVTVVLTGEGADELFGGYPRYLIPKLASATRNIPFSRPALRLLGRLTGDHRPRLVAEFLDMPGKDAVLLNAALARSRNPSSFLSSGLPKDPLRTRRVLLEDTDWDPFTGCLYQDLKTYLVSILMRQDKMSMAASIESRIPFLDYRIIEYSYTLAPALKQKGLNTKFVLKTLARKYLPDEIVDRRKAGFGVPLEAWFRRESALGNYMDVLRDPSVPMLDAGLVRRYVDAGPAQPHYYETIWNLLNLELWYRLYVKRTWTVTALEPVAAPPAV